jgi:hypothetical protein
MDSTARGGLGGLWESMRQRARHDDHSVARREHGGGFCACFSERATA